MATDTEESLTEDQATRFWGEVDKMLKEQGVNYGCPLGLGREHLKLAGDSRDPLITRLLDINQRDKSQQEGYGGEIIKNHWRMSRSWNGWYGTVVVYEEDGRRKKELIPQRPPAFERANMWLDTGAARLETTLLKAERTARKKLQELLSRQQWECYELNDAFLENGKSGMVYFIRKGRPTLAMRESPGIVRMVCTLCLHPLAYYAGTWAGALSPSDEVISHLLHIRGDEYNFWKKANHIQIDDPRSGI